MAPYVFILSLFSFFCLTVSSNTLISSVISCMDWLLQHSHSFSKNSLCKASSIYDDEDNYRHTCIIFSDIEKSLYASSNTRVDTENLNDILYEALPEYNLGHVFYKILYQFNHEEKKELTYDGVIHLQCPILDFITSKP